MLVSLVGREMAGAQPEESLIPTDSRFQTRWIADDNPTGALLDESPPARRANFGWWGWDVDSGGWDAAIVDGRWEKYGAAIGARVDELLSNRDSRNWRVSSHSGQSKGWTPRYPRWPRSSRVIDRSPARLNVSRGWRVWWPQRVRSMPAFDLSRMSQCPRPGVPSRTTSVQCPYTRWRSLG